MIFARRLATALSFLTRLTPAPRDEVPDFAGSVPYFPVVGLILGALAIAPFWLGLLRNQPLIAAWLLVGAGLYLTRGLHYDGLADLCDAWGSLAEKERFFAVMKDSRIGAFGALGIGFCLLGQTLVFAALFERQDYGAAIWCFVFGRAGAVVLMGMGRELLRPGLGALFLPGARGGSLVLTLCLTLACGLALAPVAVLAASALVAAPFLAALIRLARRHQGLNGDFLGAAVVGCELCAGLAGLLA